MAKTEKGTMMQHAAPLLAHALWRQMVGGHYRADNQGELWMDWMALTGVMKHADCHPDPVESGPFNIRWDGEMCLVSYGIAGQTVPTAGQIGVMPMHDFSQPVQFTIMANAAQITARTIPEGLDKLKVHLHGLAGMAIMSRVL